MSEHIADDLSKKGPAPYSNPYLAGIGLGLMLLAAFVIVGRGLGASGAFSSAVATCVGGIAPGHAAGNEFYQNYLGGDVHPMKSWLVFEVIGVFVGGLLSGGLARRLGRSIDKGPRIGNGTRFAMALAGGALMGYGAKLARGCTSGQALTGGATLNLGSWATMMCIFGGAYALAYFLRRAWT